MIMQAPALAGVVLGARDRSGVSLTAFLLFAAANFLFAAHSFCFNDWSGALLDERDPHKASYALLRRGVERSRILMVACMLGLFSAGLFACLGVHHLFIVLVMLLLSTLYSFPHHRYEGKRRVGWSSVLHLAGGLLYVLNGYILFHAPDVLGVQLGLFFGLAITAGHLAQEVQDHAGDRGNGIPTAAVRLGPRTVFLISLMLFSLAHLQLAWLACAGWLAAPAQVLILLWPVQLVLAWHTLRQGLAFDTVQRYRRGYQIIFGLMAGALCLSALG